MSQDAEKYLYFKVGLLKDSFALQALQQDASRYHMIDQPAQLIALRLTEYYENMQKDSVHPPASILMQKEQKYTSADTVKIPKQYEEQRQHSSSSIVSYQALQKSSASADTSDTAINADNEDLDLVNKENRSLTVSAGVDQNAEDAADYWSLL